jgi:DNA polymerase-2
MIEQAFILSRHWRDVANGLELVFWVATQAGPRRLRVASQEAVFFLAEEELEQAKVYLKSLANWRVEKLKLKDFDDQAVVGVYFKSQNTLRKARDCLFERGLNPLESDINPCDRFLMERFIRGSIQLPVASEQKKGSIESADLKSGDWKPLLRVVSVDIETSMQADQLYSIAVLFFDDEGERARVFLKSDSRLDDQRVQCYKDEKRLLEAFFDWLQDYDPDVLIGWNVVNFDCRVLQNLSEKHRLKCRLSRDGEAAYWQRLDDEGERWKLLLSGRVVLDGISLLKAATYRFDSFSLSHVASELLNDDKLLVGDDRGEKITELFQNDLQTLVDYNIHDCRLVWHIFEQEHLLDFSIARTKMTGLPLDRVGGSVAAFDFRYLPVLHRAGYVAPNGHMLEEIEHSPGGFVMDSTPGIYSNVLVLDFKSLYPSIIRTFYIDPLGLAKGTKQSGDAELVSGFRGGVFEKQGSLLREIIADLWRQRDKAKQDENHALSQAIKILMNSFYGVLGSGGCRFFDPRLASSITRRGHQVIQETAAYIEEKGWRVIYGDTDSVFVWLGDDCDGQQAASIGRRLAASLNQWWQQRLQKECGVYSVLEIEFETYFQRFLMPTIRGSSQGSKKRYAGLVVDGDNSELVFKGLESVRSDWTPLAKQFQYELYGRVFLNSPYREYIIETVKHLMVGDSDSLCVYRKRLRRQLDEYQKNIPPHVQAARKLQQWTGKKIRRGDWVEYVMTINGAEPATAQRSLLDRQYYLDRQLMPVADAVLGFLSDSFTSIIDDQLSMF